MAIYSLNLSSVGKTTHAAGTAGAHMRYIGRERAASEIMAVHMPEDPQAARVWMDTHERESRKNARLCDKIRLALPRELTEAERGTLVQDYMNKLTGGNRVPWYAAIHQTETDAHNPHAHVVVVDRDIETGKRVLALSDSVRDRQKKGLPGPKAVDWVRESWEACANAALERAGHDARIDRRSLEDQGVDREPQIHIGPQAQQIETFVQKPKSKAVPSPSPRQPDRVIDYPSIDAGRTRRERNAEIIDLNLERHARSEHFETRVMAQFERDQRAFDRAVDAQVIEANRKRTEEERQHKRVYAREAKKLRDARNASAKLWQDWTQQRFAPDRAALKALHAGEREKLEADQKRLLGRLWAKLDISGRTQRRREEERRIQIERHAEQRKALSGRIRAERTVQRDIVRGRFNVQMDKLQARKREEQVALLAKQELERRQDDVLLQTRAYEREKARQYAFEQITAWKRSQREQKPERKAKAVKGVVKRPDPPTRSQISPSNDRSAPNAASSPRTAFEKVRGQTDQDRAARVREQQRRRLREQFNKARKRGRDKDRGRDYDI